MAMTSNPRADEFFDRLADDVVEDDDIVPTEGCSFRAREMATLSRALDRRQAAAIAARFGVEPTDADEVEDAAMDDIAPTLRELDGNDLARMMKRLRISGRAGTRADRARAIHAELVYDYLDKPGWNDAAPGRVSALRGTLDDLDLARITDGAGVQLLMDGKVTPPRRVIRRTLHHLTRRTLRTLATRLVPIRAERATRLQLVRVVEAWLLGGVALPGDLAEGGGSRHVATLGLATAALRGSFRPCLKTHIRELVETLQEGGLLDAGDNKALAGTRDDLVAVLGTGLTATAAQVVDVLAGLLGGRATREELSIRLAERYAAAWTDATWVGNLRIGGLPGRRLSYVRGDEILASPGGGGDDHDRLTVAWGGLLSAAGSNLGLQDASVLGLEHAVVGATTGQLLEVAQATSAIDILDLERQSEIERVHLASLLVEGVPLPGTDARLP